MGADTTVPNVVGQTGGRRPKSWTMGLLRTRADGTPVTDQTDQPAAPIVPGNASIILYLGQEKPDDPYRAQRGGPDRLKRPTRPSPTRVSS